MACAIAQGKTVEQIDEMVIYLSQLSESLAAISSLKSKQEPTIGTTSTDSGSVIIP